MMGEEFDTCIDTSDVGTSPDIDTPDVSNDIPGDEPGDISAGVFDDEPEDIVNEFPEDIPEDIQEEEPGDSVGDIPDDIPEDIQENEPEDTVADIPDDIPEDDLQDGGDNIVEDISDDEPENLVDDVSVDLQDDVTEDIQEDGPRDLVNDISDDIPEDLSENAPEDLVDDMPEGMPEDEPQEVEDNIVEEISENAPEDLVDDMPEDLPGDVTENVHNEGTEHVADEVPTEELEDYVYDVDNSDVAEHFTGGSEEEVLDEYDKPKVLTREPLELLQTGNKNIKDILDIKADDYQDKGYTDTQIAEMLERDKLELQKEFLQDAFPGQDISTDVFSSIENGNFNKDDWFSQKQDDVSTQNDLIYKTTPSREMIDAEEYQQYNDIYNKLDTFDISQEYKDVLVNRFSEMDTDLKSEYNKYADKLVCLDSSYAEVDENGIPQDAAYFSPAEGGFKINQESDLNNPLGAGNTFFHESGHMLDWLKGQENGGVNVSTGSFMTEAIHEDYYDAINKIQCDYNCDVETAQDILSMELMSDPVGSNCVSDVFGGVSYNKVSGAWGHSTEYWQERSRDAIGKEAFAEITADRACNNTSSMEFTKKYLPKTLNFYEIALKKGGQISD